MSKNSTIMNDGPTSSDNAPMDDARLVAPPLPPRRTDPAGRNPVARATRFVEEARIELQKATWPTREQLINLTVVVVAVCVFVGVFLGAVDFVFQQLVRQVIG